MAFARILYSICDVGSPLLDSMSTDLHAFTSVFTVSWIFRSAEQDSEMMRLQLLGDAELMRQIQTVGHQIHIKPITLAYFHRK